VTGAGELLAVLGGPAPVDALRRLDADGTLTRLIPELEEGRGFRQPSLHAFTVLEHHFATVAAFDEAIGVGARAERLRSACAWFDLDAALDGEVEGLAIPVLTRLACLVHDVAKPATAVFQDGRLRFPRHGPVGAEKMAARLPQLGFSEGATDFVCRLVRQHLRPRELVQNHPVTDRAVRRFVADVDGHVVPLMLLNLSDGWGTRGPAYTDEHFDRHTGFLNYVVARAWSVTRPGVAPLLTGEDLMAELDLRSGRLLGAVLLSVRRAQEEQQIMTREEALTLARSILREVATSADAPSEAQG